MSTIHFSLPTPNEQEVARSKKLITHLRDLIQKSGGRISFADYMERVLYEPELGYYTNGNTPFGRDGDFITAPEISPLFSRCLAEQCGQILNAIGTSSPSTFKKGGVEPAPENLLIRRGILEIGAGSGKMAAELLLACEKQGQIPTYSIFERSKALRNTQRETLLSKTPHLLSHVRWLDTWPETWTGVIIANEWLDALPIHRFVIQKGKMLEQAVTWKSGRFQFTEIEPLSAEFPTSPPLPLKDGFCSELSLTIPPVIQKIATFLKRGAVLLIDYGYSEREYYHPSRSSGTLQCHYRHLAHSDPFLYPGLQDITAHVNFTLAATTALEAGLDIMGFTQQASFLMSCGLPRLFDTLYSKAMPKEQIKLSQQVKWLTMPDEMGERFWVMGLSKNYSGRWLGFEDSNLLHRL